MPRGAPLPILIKPQLATLARTPPPGKWLYEIKFDGYRLMCRIERGRASFFTRNGNDWTDRLAALRSRMEKQRLPDGWYDGEMVVLDEQGLPSFYLLQSAFKAKRTADIVLFLFDMPFCAGVDLRRYPLEERRRALENLLDGGSSHIRFSETLAGSPRDLVRSACKMGLEGLIGKRPDSPYVSRRSDAWIKLKCSQRQEFVIGGYTTSGSALGGLLLGVYDDDKRLLYAGSVGTGFGGRTLSELNHELSKIPSLKSPFATTRSLKGAHWVEPRLVAEVSFAEWTPSGKVRHAAFKGLRLDKDAHQVRREVPKM